MELNFRMALCKVYSMAVKGQNFYERNYLDMTEIEIPMSNIARPPLPQLGFLYC